MKSIKYGLIGCFTAIILFHESVFATAYMGSNNSSCNTNKIIIDLKIEPNNKCLDISVVKDCYGGHNLYIKSSCNDKYYLLDENSNKITMVPGNIFSEGLILNKNLIDYSILKEKGIWNRKLVNINNDNDLINIEGINKYSIIYYIQTLLIILLLLLVLGYFIYSFNNFNKKHYKNK